MDARQSMIQATPESPSRPSVVGAWLGRLRTPTIALVALAGAVHLVLTPVFHFFLFHPPAREDLRVARIGERVSYAARDGVELSGWFVRARGERRRAVLYFHGNGVTASDCWPWADALADAGADVLLAEYRGYGRSGGERTAHGIELDGEAALEALRARGARDEETVIHGQSLGGAVAVHVLAGAGRSVAGGVLESTFTSLHDMSRSMFGVALTHLVPDAQALDSAARAPSIRAPIFQVHGDRDLVVPFRLGERLHRALTAADARFLRIRGGAHTLDDAESAAAIRRFVAEVAP